MSSPYVLELSQEDVDTIYWVGDRYGWSSALLCYGEGRHGLSESEAWEIRNGCEEDTEGGHSYFPLLAQDSDLAQKLFDLIDSIV